MYRATCPCCRAQATKLCKEGGPWKEWSSGVAHLERAASKAPGTSPLQYCHARPAALATAVAASRYSCAVRELRCRAHLYSATLLPLPAQPSRNSSGFLRSCRVAVNRWQGPQAEGAHRGVPAAQPSSSSSCFMHFRSLCMAQQCDPQAAPQQPQPRQWQQQGCLARQIALPKKQAHLHGLGEVAHAGAGQQAAPPAPLPLLLHRLAPVVGLVHVLTLHVIERRWQHRRVVAVQCARAQLLHLVALLAHQRMPDRDALQAGMHTLSTGSL